MSFNRFFRRCAKQDARKNDVLRGKWPSNKSQGMFYCLITRADAISRRLFSGAPSPVEGAVVEWFDDFVVEVA